MIEQKIQNKKKENYGDCTGNKVSKFKTQKSRAMLGKVRVTI